MKFSLRPQKSSEFGKKLSIAEDLILLAFETDRQNYKTNLVGLKSTKDTLVVYEIDTEKESAAPKNYKLKCSHKLDFPVYHVITGLVNAQAENAYILVEKDANFRVHYFDFGMAAPALLHESEMMPFLMVNERLERFFLIRSGGKYLKMVMDPHSETRTRTEPWEREVGDVGRNHTSAFIDLDGDGQPDMIMDTLADGQRVVRMVLSRYGVKTVDVPGESGPLVFEDFDRDGRTDMCYVASTPGDGNFLKILYNDVEGDDVVFTRESTVTLSSLFPDYDPVLRALHIDGMPGGIFVYHMELSQCPQICLLMRHRGRDEYDLKLLTCTAEGDESSLFFKKKRQDAAYDASRHRRSLRLGDTRLCAISCIDPEGSGREGLLLNVIDDGKYALWYFENNLEVNHYKLSLVTLEGQAAKNAYNNPIPGVSYSISVDNRTLVSHQLPQSSFLHLRKAITTLGLGSANLLIENIRIGVPYNNHLLEVNQKIIPNSDLVFTYRNGKISTELLLKYGFYIRIVFFVLAVVLAVNMIFVILFTMLERRKNKLEKKKESAAFNFKAL